VLIYFTIMFACVLPNEAEFQADQVRIHVNVSSNIYTYTVTNLDTSPVIGFEIREHNAYNFTAPENWDKEISGGFFRARVTNKEAAVFSGKSADFSMRSSSKGSVLGYEPVKVQFQSGKTVAVPNVWAPAPEPRGYIALVVAIVLIILLLHTTVLVYKDSRRKKAFVSEP
jgi:hypothetical protein